MTTAIDFFDGHIFYELDDLKHDADLLRAAQVCIDVQKSVGGEMLRTFFKPDPQAADQVSEEALNRMLSSGEMANDIRADRSISNCIVFNSRNLEGSVLSDRLVRLRNKTNSLVADRMKKRFRDSCRLSLVDSGHFWYPPGGYMKWHTNIRTPGWRLYVSYAEEPGRSFFRYRDPDSGKIRTSWDDGWNFRLFRVDPAKLFWHCVYSETNRFSLGYRLFPSSKVSFAKRIKGKLVSIWS